ncbi:Epoxyqueuosine reductase [Alphaproteobacteria bacterium SO-S41]|nr:Epoxyqueuosine reductase [Alphaproteobacteria bacterium SO-S41]
MRSSISDQARLRRTLDAKAKALGFDALRVTRAETTPETAAWLNDFVAAGRHGTMAWMEETLARRSGPKALWPDAKSAIVVAMNYGPDEDPLAVTRMPGVGAISVYARGRDYHDVIKGKLKELAAQVARLTEAEVKVFVDTAPLMEKPLAMAAGLGWQGKHTNLVSRDFGSWLFLGVILTAAELDTDARGEDICGSCRACLDACPTDAFPAPYQLDARRCISYLTIEHDGFIDHALRVGIGNRIYGCDDCLAVCPWNKFAQAGREVKLAARVELNAPSLADLAALDDAGFRALFTASPVKRIGRDRFVRNVLIAIGNSGEARLLPVAERLLDDAAAQVRGMAVWACRRLMDAAAFAALKSERLAAESDEAVKAEWR